MKPLTLQEAAEFLRMSCSSLYQRKDIPRYRRPGSRVMLFDQDELEAWLKQGRIGSNGQTDTERPLTTVPPTTENESAVVAISPRPVYHRTARYR